MNRVIPFFFLVSLSNSSLAQINVDSLWNVWNDETQADTNRLKAMDDLSFKYYLTSAHQQDSAFLCGQIMLDLAKQKGLKKHQANALHNMGTAMSNRGSFDKALDLMSQSLVLREEIGDKKGIGRSLANMGEIHTQNGDHSIALDHYKRSLKNFEAVGDLALIAHALNNMSDIYSELGDYPKAIQCISRALSVAEESGEVYFLAHTLLSLSRIYQKINDFSKAKKYAERASAIAIKSQLKLVELFALSQLGEISLGEGDYESALVYADETLSKTDEAEDAQLRSKAYRTMGEAYEKKGDYDNALKNYGIAHNLEDSFGGNLAIFTNSIAVGTIYQLKKDGRNAVKWCNEALVIAQEVNSLESQIKACKCLYESYKMLNKGNKALEYHERFLALSDSLQKGESSKKLQQMEFAKQVYQDSIATAEKERLVQDAHEEEVRKKNNTRNALIGGGLFLFLLASSIYSRLRYIRRSKATLQVEKDRSDNLLLNILPEEIAQELKEKGKADARDFDMVSILFTDFKGFTEASAKLSAQDLVSEINICFEAFDGIMAKYGVEKIKTIGDAYMAAGGLPVPTDDSVKNTVLAALEMQAFISQRKLELDTAGKPAFEMRVGIHTGPVVAGIVGVKKFQYDIWGDTVNTASRMESSGAVGKVNISQSTYEMLKEDAQFTFENRGKIEAKGKGEIEMYFVNRSLGED